MRRRRREGPAGEATAPAGPLDQGVHAASVPADPPADAPAAPPDSVPPANAPAAPPDSVPPANAPASAPAAGTSSSERFALPSSGLAAEILAGLGGPSPAGGRPAGGRERVYSFADSLERRGHQAELPQEQPESWVVFALAGESYGLPVAAVQEILRAGTITRVPHAPAPVRGITNLRGRVLAVVDLRVRLGLPPAALDARSRILVVDSRQRVLGLLVDAVLQVSKLLPSAILPPPPDVMSVRSDYLRGVVHLHDQLIIALELDRVLLIQDDDLTTGLPADAVEGPHSSRPAPHAAIDSPDD